MHRIPLDQLRRMLEQALHSLNITGERGTLSARLIAETDLDGVSTHGTARFPRFASMVRAGRVHPLGTPALTKSFGALERWDGRLGPGNLCAHAAMQRAMQLADQHGLGGVALANTNHWQRGGSYGWQAADAGYAAICWTNTLPNLPPWGAKTPALGNNPLVIAVPCAGEHGNSTPIVLDMAMSQFSYGTLAAYRERGVRLPVPGGYDAEGHLTADAGAIEATQRALPIGYWKGSGLSFALDVLGAMLADGRATHEIAPDAELESGVTQIFMAVAPQALASHDALRSLASEAVAFLHAAEPVVAGERARYPGEGVLATRQKNRREGVPVSGQFLLWLQQNRHQ